MNSFDLAHELNENVSAAQCRGFSSGPLFRGALRPFLGNCARITTVLGFTICLITSSGCVSMKTFGAAEGYKVEEGKAVDFIKPKPALYAVLPLALGLDMMTLPLQAAYSEGLQDERRAERDGGPKGDTH